MKFKQGNFYSNLHSSVSPHEIKYGDVIKLSNDTFFEIDDIDIEYADNSIADSEIVNLKNNKFTFYGCNGTVIEEIPFNAEFSIFRPLEPVDLQFIDIERINKYNRNIQEKIDRTFENM